MVTESKDYFQMFPIYNGHQQQQQQQKQQHIKCFLKHWTATAGVNSSKFNAERKVFIFQHLTKTFLVKTKNGQFFY